MPLAANVLLIDDDEISNFLTATVLRNSQAFGHIQITSDGQEALDWLQAQQASNQYPDLILLDLNMPTMNGFNFLKALRNLPGIHPKPCIFVLSVSNYQEDIENLKQFPEVKEFLPKPLTKESLQHILAKYFSC